MHLSAFDYDLPEHLIAQEPAGRRDQSRLLVLRRPAGLSHHTFAELPGFLAPGDLLVLNDTRVVAARLVGRRARTEGRWEGLFVREHPGRLWELLVQTRGRLLVGETLLVDAPHNAGGGVGLRLVLRGKTPGGRWLVRPEQEGSAEELLARHGQVPIPPYVRKGRPGGADAERYQTIYARNAGAVAAPTAGLHFTPELFAALAGRGVAHAFVTLHVGPGTFQPVKAEDVTQHVVEPEWGEVPGATAEAVRLCKQRGNRVVAVGTTTVRVLETAAREGPGAWSGLCGLTILPGFSFAVVDALVTNFHLPRSSLLLLVSAFAGLDAVKAAYAEAVAHEYRFYSYGDAMLLL
jgi:S-adenosylmethionine:tRNA ribosyltransferase-isomerase